MTEMIARLAEALADRYRIESQIGAGGMATVYLAEDLKHRRKVALKGESLRGRLIREKQLPVYDALQIAREVALAEGRLLEATDALWRFDDSNDCETCAYAWLARAYDQRGMTDSAMALYERFVELPSAEIWYDGGHLAHGYRRLDELYEDRGETRKAVDYYSRFVDLWQNADREFQPQVREIKERIARLAGEPLAGS